jgi:hypothetical protein
MAEEVLRIRVEMDGDSTRKVEQFRRQASGVRNDMQPIQRQMRESTAAVSEFQRSLGGLGREALGVTRPLMEVARVAGVLPAAIGLIGLEIARHLGAMREWSASMVTMGNSARQAGLGYGQFRSITEQFERAGVSAKAAAALVQGFNQAYEEVLRKGSDRRNELIAGAGMGNAGAMVRTLEQLGEQRTEVERLNFIRVQGENVYRNEYLKTHNAVLASQKERWFLEKFNAQELMTLSRDLTQEDATQIKHQDEMLSRQQKLTEALTEEEQIRKQIYDEAMDWTTGFSKAIVDLGTLIEKNILQRMLQTAPAWSMGRAAPERPGPQYGPQGGWGNMFGLEQAPGTFGERFGERRRQTPREMSDAEKLRRYGRGLPTQPQAQPQQFTSEATQGALAGLGPGSLGYGDITAGWRRSPIEDERSEESRVADSLSRSGESGRDLTETVDTSTKEFHQLNQNILQLLDTNIFGGARGGGTTPVPALAQGGIVQGPTKALVGEAGSEAIVGPSGTRIVHSPTIATLGTRGPEAVIPIGKHRSDMFQTGGPRSDMFQTDNLVGKHRSDMFQTDNFVGGHRSDMFQTDNLVGGRRSDMFARDVHRSDMFGPPDMPRMAEGGIVIPQSEKHIPPRSLFSREQFSNYLERTGLGSNPLSDIGNAVSRGWDSRMQQIEARAQDRGATTPLGALMHALPGNPLAAIRPSASLAVSPLTGLAETTVGRAYAGITGMPREMANEAAGTALMGAKGIPAITDAMQVPTAARFTLQGMNKVGSFSPPQSIGFGQAAAAPVSFADPDSDRANVNASLSARGGNGGGSTEGTITISHQVASPPSRRAPLFRPVTINRQAQMLPAGDGMPHPGSLEETSMH